MSSTQILHCEIKLTDTKGTEALADSEEKAGSLVAVSPVGELADSMSAVQKALWMRALAPFRVAQPAQV
jgi:hypothetical protein